MGTGKTRANPQSVIALKSLGDRPPLSMEEVAARARVSMEILHRYVHTSSDPEETKRELAYDGITPEMQGLLAELDDDGLDEFLDEFLKGPDRKFRNYQLKELKAFAAYARVSTGAISDFDMRDFLYEAQAVLGWVAKIQSRLWQRRIKRPSQKLRKFEARLGQLCTLSDDTQRFSRTLNVWNQVTALVSEGRLYDVADQLFPDAYDRSNVLQHFEFWSNPETLHDILGEHLRRNPVRRRKEAMPDAVKLLRDQFLALVDCKLCARAGLRRQRKPFRQFVDEIFGIYDVRKPTDEDLRLRGR